MTATTVDINTPRQEGEIIARPVAAAETIYLGTLVCRNASGYLVDGEDLSTLKFEGVSDEGVDNSTGLDAAETCKTRRRGLHKFASSGLAITDEGCDMYLSDNKTVTKLPTNIYVGKLAIYVSATLCWIDIAPALGLPPSDDVDLEEVGVAANKAISAAGVGVCLDADGYLVEMDDGTAVSFWGASMEAVDNTGGADGAVKCWVRRSGVVDLAAAGLAATDAGKEVWQTTDSSTVTTTPGAILAGVLEFVDSAIVAHVRIKPMPIVGQRTDRQFTIPFGHSGAALNGKSAFVDQEFPRKYLPLCMHFALETAPGGSDTLTCTLTDGTKTYAATATGAAVFGENKTPQAFADALAAATDTDLTLADSSTTSADVKGEVLCEAL